MANVDAAADVGIGADPYIMANAGIARRSIGATEIRPVQKEIIERKSRDRVRGMVAAHDKMNVVRNRPVLADHDLFASHPSREPCSAAEVSIVAIPIPSMSVRPMPSGRISTCGWECGVLRD